MSMSDYIKQQVLLECFAKKVSFSWKTAILPQVLSFYQSGRASIHLKNMLLI